MKNFPAIVARVATVALVSSVPALAANAAADAAGYRASDFEVMSRAHQITITVVNGKLDADLPAGRRDEASKIMQAVEKSNAGRVEFGQVMMIRLEDVTRQGTWSMIIQGFDFDKAPTRLLRAAHRLRPDIASHPSDRPRIAGLRVAIEALADRRAPADDDRPAPMFGVAPTAVLNPAMVHKPLTMHS